LVQYGVTVNSGAECDVYVIESERALSILPHLTHPSVEGDIIALVKSMQQLLLTWEKVVF